MDEWERTKEHRELVGKEVKELNTQHKQLQSDVNEKHKELKALMEKNAAAKSEADKNKSPDDEKHQKQLDYYEGEVRRLESRLTEQKVSYEKQLKVHIDRLKELESEELAEKVTKDAEDYANDLFKNLESEHLKL